MGRSRNASLFVDCGFLTESKDIADCFNNYFTNKVSHLRKGFATQYFNYCELIKNEIMVDKMCNFNFNCVQSAEVMSLLKLLPAHVSPGTDNLNTLGLNKTAE